MPSIARELAPNVDERASPRATELPRVSRLLLTIGAGGPIGFLLVAIKAAPNAKKSRFCAQPYDGLARTGRSTFELTAT
jgi:hypothetical protein